MCLIQFLHPFISMNVKTNFVFFFLAYDAVSYSFPGQNNGFGAGKIFINF